ncbi:Sugar transferase involved in LPS biosynthesis (colanic, teichoic acid) [Ruegeria halocynthiae]|uniref:Sugar transferase involved in LPS biosynthesis (Colanic, teichoic acid) n=1 Tax=Ruegeria halocynthiae TaxID=985054 RepID=A0A1H2Y4R1_9RHOB|nr:sugar transferase [Ruegeria halocynthiae]SDW99808.1 Sugar transferase involved in LPS biosynthesis (colanic, teichoic acid) [Ruegeria halocynthiae]
MTVQDTSFSCYLRSASQTNGIVSASSESPGAYPQIFKRAVDLVFVVLALPIVLPFILGMAALIACDGTNPFYGQKRVGRNGKLFTMWKLRSMVPNAYTQLDRYLADNPAARKEWDETQKLKNDPRITALGRVLRKTSLDELPQLFNVLTGDMSLVGPRPMMPDQQGLYPGTAYYALRPGITGLWQVSDRNEGSFASRADFDATYSECLSFRTDLSVLFATAGVVLRGTGY